MDGPAKLRINCPLPQPAERLAFAARLMTRLTPKSR
jgi:hypothetical protein